MSCLNFSYMFRIGISFINRLRICRTQSGFADNGYCGKSSTSRTLRISDTPRIIRRRSKSFVKSVYKIVFGQRFDRRICVILFLFKSVSHEFVDDCFRVDIQFPTHEHATRGAKRQADSPTNDRRFEDTPPSLRSKHVVMLIDNLSCGRCDDFLKGFGTTFGQRLHTAVAESFDEHRRCSKFLDESPTKCRSDSQHSGEIVDRQEFEGARDAASNKRHTWSTVPRIGKFLLNATSFQCRRRNITARYLRGNTL